MGGGYDPNARFTITGICGGLIDQLVERGFIEKARIHGTSIEVPDTYVPTGSGRVFFSQMFPHSGLLPDGAEVPPAVYECGSEGDSSQGDKE